MACRLNDLSNPSINSESGDDHTLIMTTLPFYCKANPDDKRAIEKLFQHTYTHLQSWIYKNPSPYGVTQDDYLQECYIAFWKRLQTFKPEKCRDNRGWYGVLGFIRKDVERAFLHKYSKHTKYKVSSEALTHVEQLLVEIKYGRKMSSRTDNGEQVHFSGS